MEVSSGLMSKEGKAAPLECEGCKYLTEELSPACLDG